MKKTLVGRTGRDVAQVGKPRGGGSAKRGKAAAVQALSKALNVAVAIVLAAGLGLPAQGLQAFADELRDAGAAPQSNLMAGTSEALQPGAVQRYELDPLPEDAEDPAASAASAAAEGASPDDGFASALRYASQTAGFLLGQAGQAPVSEDGTTIESITVHWLTADTQEDDDPAMLVLAPQANAQQDTRFQVDFALSGEHAYKPGDIELHVPAQVWRDRAGNLVGGMNLSVPEEPETSTDFSYRFVNGEYIITNNRTIDAASKYMFQFRITNVSPQVIADGATCDEIVPHLMLLTNAGNTLEAESAPIAAKMITYEKLSAATTKSGATYTRASEAPGLPESFLPENPDDYFYVRWYTYATYVGNKPFTLTMQDSLPEEGALLLGAVVDGTEYANDPQGNAMSLQAFSGWDTHGSSRYAYVWAAYPKAAMNADAGVYTLNNEVTWTLVETDEETGAVPDTTTLTAANTATYRAPRTYTLKVEWENDGSEDAIIHRPEAVDMRLYQVNRQNNNRSYYDAVQVRADEDWTCTWTDDRQVDYRFEANYPDIDWYVGSDSQADGGCIIIVKYRHYDGELPHGTEKMVVGKDPVGLNDRNANSLGDKMLNTLRTDGRIEVSYTASADIGVMFYTLEAGAGEHEVGKYGKRPVAIEVVDSEVDFEGLGALRAGEYELTQIVLSAPEAQEAYRPTDWSTEVLYRTVADAADLPALEVWGRSATQAEGTFTRYATFAYAADGTCQATAENGATADADTQTVAFPANASIIQAKVAATTTYPGLKVSFSPTVRLFCNDEDASRIANRLASVFESQDFPNEQLSNVVNVIATSDETNMAEGMHGTKTGGATGVAYLHGRDVKVATYASKTMTVTGHDAVNRRSTVHNTVTAVEQSNVRLLSEYNDALQSGLVPTDGNSTWYDLLPKGMEYVQNSVRLADGDVLTDVQTYANYKGSGRTLLVVKGLMAQHRSAGSVSDRMTGFAGYRNTQTLQFDSYYSWESYTDWGSHVENVAAFETGHGFLANAGGMAGEDDANPLGGKNKFTAAALGEDVALMTGLDPQTAADPSLTAGRFAYARGTAEVVPEVTALTGLSKRVTIDGSGLWSDGNRDETIVGEGQGYSYMLRVLYSTGVTKDLVILDSLDSYEPTERNEEDYGKPGWQGVFSSIDVSQLEEKGVRPVVYYSTEPKTTAQLEAGLFRTNAAGHYVDANGREEDQEGFTEYAVLDGWQLLTDATDPTTVRAIAIDATHTTQGADFELARNVPAVVYVHMVSPTGDAARKAIAEKAHAFNNVYLHSSHSESGAAGFGPNNVHFDYTRVGIEPLEITAHKTWDDDDDRDGLRPDKVTLRLLANGQDTGASVVLDGQPDEGLEDTDDGETAAWTATFKNLPWGNAKGERITYTLAEDAVEGYAPFTYLDQNGDFVVENDHEPILTSVSGEKTWAGENGSSERPDYLAVRLQRSIDDGATWHETGQAKVVQDDGTGTWAYSFTGLNQFRNHGQHILYRVQETPVHNYAGTYMKTEDGYDITNTWHPYGDLVVSKTVENGTETALAVPFSFTLLLNDAQGEVIADQFDYEITRADGTIVKTGQIGNGVFELHHGESLRVKELPTDTAYTVTEAEQAGFAAAHASFAGSIAPNEDNLAAFVNTYQAQGSYNPAVRKVLENRELTRGQFSFRLYDANGGADDGHLLRTAGNLADGTATFGALRFTEADDGRTFTYRIEEVDRSSERPGYTFDTRAYTLKLAVSDNGDGTMNVVPAYYDEAGEAVSTADVAFTNEYHATGSLALTAYKSLPGRTLKAGEFSFELTDSEGHVVGERASNAADGRVAFDAIDLTEQDIGKTYEYVAREVVPAAADADPTVVYNEDAEIHFRVTVVDNGDGTLSFSQKTYDKDGAEASPVIENSLAPGTLTLAKRALSAQNADPDQLFTFRVELTGSDLPDGALAYDVVPAEQQVAALSTASVEGDTPTPAAAEPAPAAVRPMPAVESISDDETPLAGASLSTQATVSQTGTNGTCTWTYYNDGSFVVAPTDGVEGTLEGGLFPSYEVRSRAKSVSFEGIVHAASCNNMFYNCLALTSLDLSGLDTSHVTDMSGMFGWCESLKAIDLSSLDTSQVTNMSSMFRRCSALTAIDLSSLDTSRVTNMSEMFYHCSSLRAIDLSVLDTSQVTDMRGMFYESGLRSLGLTSLDTSNVEYMGQMFAWCTSLEVLDLSGLDTSKVRLMNGMFEHCSSLKALDLSGFDTGNATTMNSMFQYCNSLKEIDLSNFDTSKATIMGNMFRDCSSLVSLDLSSFDTSQVTEMTFMFESCTSLVSLDLSGFDTGKVTRMTYMFQNCFSLASLDLSGFDTGRITNMYGMFNNCRALQALQLGPKTAFLSNASFPGANWYHVPTGIMLSAANLRNNSGKNSSVAPAGMWTQAEYPYTIAYDANGGDGTMPNDVLEVTTTQVTIADNAFIRDESKWKFAGWNTSADGSGDWYEPGQVVADFIEAWGYPTGQTVTLYAQWKPADAYTVNFDAGDGSGSMARLYGSAGTDTALPDSSFFLFDHHIAGWVDANDASKTFGINGPIRAGTYAMDDAVTLTPVWEENDHTINVQDGTFTVSLRAGEKMVLRDLPAGTAYRIYEDTPSGWVLVSQRNASGEIAPNAVSDATFTNQYVPGAASASIVATKLLDGLPAGADEGFAFSLYEGSLLVQGSIISGANGAVQFNPIVYTKAGSHEYVVREIAGTRADMNYDAHEEVVRVNVTDDGRGNLSAAVAYEDGQGAVFENTHKPGTLRITKQAEGATDAAKNDTFGVHVALSNGQEYDRTIGVGGSVEIDGIPAGTTYTVTETDLPRGWTQTGGTGLSGAIAAESTVDAVLVNSYSQPHATAIVRATKAFSGRDWQPGETATFELSGAGAGEPLPARTTAQATAAEPTASFEAIEFSMDDLRNADGTYAPSRDFNYLLSEVAGEAPGVTYDNARHSVTVRLTASGSGSLYTTVIYDGSDYTPPTFTNVYAAEPCTLAIDAYKLMDGELLREGVYSFDLYDDNPDADDAGTTPGIDDKNPRAGDAPFKQGDIVGSATVSAGGHAQVTVTPVRFTQPGTYRYIMRERIPDGAVSSEGGVVYDAATTPLDVRDGYMWTYAGVSYDGQPVYLTVNVTDEDDAGVRTGRLAASVTYDDPKATGDYDGAEFRNTYRTHDATARLSAEKHISGREALESDFFVFELTPVDGAPLRVTGEDGRAAYPGTLMQTARKANPRVTFDDLVFTYDDLVNADGTHDRARTFTYRVHEAQYDADGFDRNPGDGTWLFAGFTYAPDQYVKVNVADDGAGNLTVTYGEAGTVSMVPAVFTNTYRIANPVHVQVPVAKRIADHRGRVLPGWKTDDGEHDWSADSFTFELRSSDDDTPMPAGAQERYDGQPGKYVRASVRLADDDDTLAGALFGDIEYWKGGTYNYTIVEVLPAGVSFNHPVSTAEQLAYDTSARGVRVKVTDNGNGTLADPVLTYTGEVADDVPMAGAAEPVDDVPVFTNQEAGDTDIVLKTHKVLHGAQLQGDAFAFELYAAEASDDLTSWWPVGEPIATATNKTNGLVAGAPREFTVDDVVHEGTVHEKAFYYMGREIVPDDAVNAGGVRYADASEEQRAAGGFAYEGVTYASDWSLFMVNVRESIMVHDDPTANHVYIQKLVVGTKAADGSVQLRTLRDLGDTTPTPAQLADDSWYTWRDELDELALGQGWPIHENGFAADATARVTVEKRTTGRTTNAALPFQFVLTAEDGAPLRTSAGGTQLASLSGTAYSGGSMSFQELVFDQDDLKNVGTDGTWDGTYAASKTFTYRVHELAPDGEGVDRNDGSGAYAVGGFTYAADQFAVVNVANDGEGGLSVTYGDDNLNTLLPLEFVNAYGPAGTVTVDLEAAKALSGRDWQAGDVFTFKLSPGTNTAGVDTPMPAGAGEDADGAAYATVDVTHASVDAGNGTNAKKAAFEGIEFARAGLYRYLVTEVVPDEADRIAGVTYSAGTEHDITVQVADDGHGGLSAAVRYGAFDTVSPFVNSYSAEAATVQLTGVKTVQGALLGQGDFRLRLYQTDDTYEVPQWAVPLDTASVAPGGDGSVAGTAEFAELRFTEPGTYHYVVREDVPEDADAAGRLGAWTYDTHDCRVKVEVRDGNGVKTGALNATVSYDNAGAASASDAACTTQAAFTNTRAATGTARLAVTKQLAGRDWLDGESFDFTLTAVPRADGVDTPLPAAGGERVSVSADTPDATATFGDIVFTQDDLAVRDVSGAVVGYEPSRTFEYLVSEPASGRTVNGLSHPQAAMAHVTVADAEHGALSVSVSYGGEQVAGAWRGTADRLVVTNQYTPSPVTLNAQVQKHMTGADRVWGEGDSFTFELRAGRNTAGDGVATPLPDGASAVETAVLDDSSPRVAGDRNWREGRFGDITFTQAGTFYYTVAEQKVVRDGAVLNPVRGLHYDESVHVVRVDVADDGLGTLSASIVWEGSDGQANAPLFENEFANGVADVAVHAAKVVEGTNAPALEEGMFAFQLLDERGRVVGEAVNDADGAVTFDELTFDYNDFARDSGSDSGRAEFGYRIREVAPDDATRADGLTWAQASDAEKAAGGFSKDGMTYAADAPVQVTLIDEGDGTLSASVGYGSAGADHAVIVNTYAEPDPKPDPKPDPEPKPDPVPDVDPAPCEVDPPVTKVVVGDPRTMPTFTFAMRALTEGAPMPEGSADGRKTASIVGAGSVEFGVMRYDEAGTYRYEIAEQPAGGDVAAGWTYDTSTWNIVVDVRDEGGQLKAVRTFEKDGEAVQVAAVEVVNTYVEPSDSDEPSGDSGPEPEPAPEPGSDTPPDSPSGSDPGSGTLPDQPTKPAPTATARASSPKTGDALLGSAALLGASAIVSAAVLAFLSLRRRFR